MNISLKISLVAHSSLAQKGDCWTWYHRLWEAWVLSPLVVSFCHRIFLFSRSKDKNANIGIFVEFVKNSNILVQHMGRLLGSVGCFSQCYLFLWICWSVETNFYYQSPNNTVKFCLCNKREQPMRSNYVIICWSDILSWQIPWKFYRNLRTLTDFLWEIRLLQTNKLWVKKPSYFSTCMKGTLTKKTSYQQKDQHLSGVGFLPS